MVVPYAAPLALCCGGPGGGPGGGPHISSLLPNAKPPNPILRLSSKHLRLGGPPLSPCFVEGSPPPSDTRAERKSRLLVAPRPRSHPLRSPVPMEELATSERLEAAAAAAQVTPSSSSMRLLFVEMGVGYDQHGQDITVAAMRACKDAISSNSIPAFRRGSIPGVNSDQMKLQIKLGVPQSTQHLLDIARVKSVFPYGDIIKFEVVDGGMICSSGVCLEAMGDKNDDCYIVNAAVYVGY